MQGLGITRDATGNIYVTGYMNGSVTFGSTTITSAGSDDIFIAKYTSAGVLSWVQRIGGGAVDQGFGIATDPSGNVLVTGYFTGLVNFGGVSLTAAFYDAFALKLDPTGTVLWAKKGGGSSTDYGSGITSDASGNVYVTGYVYGNGTSTFGGLSATGYGAYDLFVIKYNSTGTEQWLRIGGGVNSDRGYGICTDVAGNVIVTGIFAATATFSTQTLTALGMQDILLLKYTSAGSLVWYRQAGGQL
ncbi:MAG: hypothetical protein EBS07_12230 [Sphingobacteriia bacterium]|nr:hypothetical protein [Sphingobacteriia bacterium]